MDDVDDELDDDLDATDDEVDDGNERAELDGGTPLAVLTYLARSLSNDPEAVVIDTEERRGGLRLSLHVAPTTWAGSSAGGAGRHRPSARWSTWPAPRTASRPAWTSSTTELLKVGQVARAHGLRGEVVVAALDRPDPAPRPGLER